MFSKLVILIVLCCSCYQGLAQATSLDFEVFQAVAARRNKGQKFIDAQNVKKGRKSSKDDRFYKEITMGVFYKVKSRYTEDKKFAGYDTVDKLVLTNLEKQKILAEHLDSMFWPSYIVKNSLALYDSATIIKDLFASDTSFYAQYDRQQVHWIGKPVFFRDNTFCVVRQCSLHRFWAGHIKSVIYKKIDGKWVVFDYVTVGTLCG
jgi:hypothetical protein